MCFCVYQFIFPLKDFIILSLHMSLDTNHYCSRSAENLPVCLGLFGVYSDRYVSLLCPDLPHLTSHRLCVCIVRLTRSVHTLQTCRISPLYAWTTSHPVCLYIPDLPHLSTLRLEYICLPPMVAGLADKCPLLQELSLKDSEKVTDREVPEIRRCLRLRSLNISGTSVTGAEWGESGQRCW